jgi:hypothetical protein
MKPDRLRMDPEKARHPLAGKRDAESCLYRAVKNYVKKLGGSVAVIGGIEIQTWPDDPKGKYRVAVHCAGVRPAEKAP